MEKTNDPRLTVKTVPLENLIPDPSNARQHDEKNLKAIQNSLRLHGQVENIVVQARTKKIIGGNGRYAAMRSLGWKSASVAMLDIDNSQATALGIALNRTAELATWDSSVLNTLLGNLKEEEFDLDHLGFSETDLIELSEQVGQIEKELAESETNEPSDVDAIPEEVPGVCRLGDIWALGDHRLFCGDSNNRHHLDLFLGNKAVDAVVTDPPYGIAVVSRKNKLSEGFAKSIAKQGVYRPVIGDEATPDVSWLLDKSPLCIIWGGNYFTNTLPPTNSWLIWDKRADSDIINTFADCEMAWSNYGGPARIHRQLWVGMIRQGERTKRVHPTQKPVALLSWCLSFVKGQIILDPYAGSGTTLMACQTDSPNKTCFAVEIDPYYCDIIMKRFTEATGILAERVRNVADDHD